ncbi:MAG: penicillin-binding protein 2 [Alphaproteobacteria bacterium]|nr:penicillin-binding protein 2 [Alphaproteobacteria bacterium]
MTGAAELGTIALDGARKTRGNQTRTRIRVLMLFIAAALVLIVGKLVTLGGTDTTANIEGRALDEITATRPAILDRNGIEMAVDIRVPSLYAEPNRMVDKPGAIAAILSVLPDLDENVLRERLNRDKGFVWIDRELTPAQKDDILRLGIPGLDFVTESRRFYPGGTEASHIMGMVNIDNKGTAGIEARLDRDNVALLQDLGFARDRELSPVSLSIDMRVQHALRDQLEDALSRYQAVSAAGVIIDVHTAEILAMVSLPDFDPNAPTSFSEDWLDKKNQRFNRITLGRYELGSTFKTITFAAALDSGAVKLTDSFDARFGIRFGKYLIDDFHGKHRVLQVPEIYKYSSNVGTIKMMQTLGSENYRAFLTRMGFDDPLKVELPETIVSVIPEKFSEVGAATASFGHGLSVTPLHMAQAVAALVNGGILKPATLYPRTSAEADAIGTRVVSQETSARMRYLLRLNALEGSGTHANKLADGYRVGGKTGTAEKVENGQYVADRNLNVFASAFPVDDPHYAMVILVDEPKPENQQSGVTAGWNAGEVTGRVIARVAPMLGIRPDFAATVDAALVPPELGRPVVTTDKDSTF